jgi:hypothetical protein
MYILPSFVLRRATVSRATARALSALEAERALRAEAGSILRSARAVVGRATQAFSRAVDGPRQAERALCTRADLGFSPEAV